MEIPVSHWSKGQAYHFLTHAVAPRPIAWVTTIGDVVNAAPFSWFQSVCADPPTLMIAMSRRDGKPKDTSRNLQSQGECVVHVVTAEFAEPMVASSADYGAQESEVEALSLTTIPSVVVAPPRLRGPVVAFECTLQSMQQIGDVDVAFLEIVHTYLADDHADERGNLRHHTALLARLGGNEYLEVATTRTLVRPIL